MTKSRIIFHVDMNSFYASVEAAYDPSLRGKPLAIAGNAKERRGIVVTASYEARAKGVKPPMPLWEAEKACPGLLVRPPDFDRYRTMSRKMFEILYSYTPLVEPVSIDEGYMDVTNVHFEGTHGLELAKIIQDHIYHDLHLPSSIGVAPNKFLAKMASDMKKPMGITVLRKREVPDILWPLRAVEMHGVGEKTADKLSRLGLFTIEDLAKADPFFLTEKFGVAGKRMHEKANGIDFRPVDPESIHDFKSIGNSTTLPKDTANRQDITRILRNLSDSVSRRLKKKDVYAGNIQLTIRYHDRKTITRSKKLSYPVDGTDDIYDQAKQLFHDYWNGRSVRLLGVTGMDLVEKGHAVKPLDLFNYEEDVKKERLQSMIGEIRGKFGEHALLRGTQIGDETASDQLRDQKGRGTSLEKDFLRGTIGKDVEDDDEE
ncbi:DNA polymerase IV [Salisediminibacterium selenitireducens]|uniref:DNA polymerase IV n=1 Tax=Bacillus selenitireducens (strain ATCC 700615 / DSM 15326 / MLS10) TaxID=439292 RepID=D6XVK6_BACIE|nr:DNA-directed DNA polymerase [[Bacillus] selenitireducens MLS10]